MAAKPTWTLQQIVNQLTHGSTSSAPWSTETLGAGRELTFSFPTTAPAEDASEPDIETFQAFSAEQKAAARMALASFGDVINVKFTETSGSAGDIRFMNLYHSSPTGYYVGKAAGPGPGRGGDVFMNRHFNGSHDVVHPVRGEAGFTTYLHEIAHAMGIGHPGNYNGGNPTYAEQALFAQDTSQYTVMSYFQRQDANNGSDHTYYDGQVQQLAETLMLYDIAALHAQYGANPTTRSGTSIYGFHSNVGSTSPYNFAANIDPVVCIYDAGGNDTLDFSGFTEKTRLDLNQGAFSDTARMAQNVSIAFGTVIENGIGGSAADVIRGNSVGNLLKGGGGSDNISGFAGNDSIYGGDNVPNGIALGSGAFRDSSASNNSQAGAANISTLFSLAADADIGSSTSIPHVQISNLSTTGGRDYFKLQINNRGAKITLDIDHGVEDGKAVMLDTHLRLLNSSGVLVAQNDDSQGSDHGSQYGNDSFLTFTVTAPGTYFIVVSSKGNVALPVGGNYELQVSVANELLPIEKLYGGIGNDRLYGERGNDYLVGGAGLDTMTGGADRDHFVFDAALGPTNIDTIADFVAADDAIRLDDAIFTKLGVWDISKFYASNTGQAHDASDRIIYETDTGRLTYDADGNKAGAAIHFATLTGHPTVGWSDFVII